MLPVRSGQAFACSDPVAKLPAPGLIHGSFARKAGFRRLTLYPVRFYSSATELTSGFWMPLTTGRAG
jgi:hypothetical protein